MIPKQIEKEIQDASDEAFNYYRISTVSLKEMFARLLHEAYEDKCRAVEAALCEGIYVTQIMERNTFPSEKAQERIKKYIATIPLITPKQ